MIPVLVLWSEVVLLAQEAPKTGFRAPVELAEVVKPPKNPVCTES
jgi:hypothetical protein